MIPRQFTHSKRQKSTAKSQFATSGICQIDKLFRVYPPAVGERERLEHQVIANRRKAQIGLQSLPSRTVDVVSDVLWFDQIPTDDLFKICGHA